MWHGDRRRWVTSSLRMGVASRRAEFVATNESIRTPAGLVLLAIVMLLLRQRNLVLTEFLPGKRAGVKGRALTSLYRFLLPRVCDAVQVMTTWEAREYARRYRLAPVQLVHIPYYRAATSACWPTERRRGEHLFCSGRNSTDWRTLLAAHSLLGEEAPHLVAVCGAREATELQRLAGPGVTVLVDIPREEHDTLLAAAALVVLPLKPVAVSCGHIRLSTAATHAVPVIASRVPGIEGYERQAALLVPPSDASALAEAISWALDPTNDLTARMAHVLDHASSWTRNDYLEALKGLPLRGRNGMSKREREAPLVVLHSPSDESNPFVRQAIAASGCDARTFTWRTALSGRFHVLHLHWPERFSRAANTRSRALRLALTQALLLRVRLCRTPVVRHLHNTIPHDTEDAVDAFVRRQWERATTHWISMTRQCDRSPHTFIPHGSYAGAYDFDLASAPVANRLLFFGRIRPYKGVDELLSIVRDHDAPFSLRVAGRPTTPELDLALKDASHIRGVSIRAEFLDESNLVEELAACVATIFPYRRMENSGAVLLALSAHRPVIVPASTAMHELQQEVGAEWLQLFSEPMDLEGITRAWDALDSLAALRDDRGPDLSARSWHAIGAALDRVYREVLL